MSDRRRPFESQIESSSLLLAAAVKSSPTPGLLMDWEKRLALAHSPSFTPFLSSLGQPEADLWSALEQITAGQAEAEFRRQDDRFTITGSYQEPLLCIWVSPRLCSPATSLETLAVSSQLSAWLRADGHFHHVSHRLSEVLGYRREEMQGVSFFDFLHPDDLALALKEFSGYVEGSSSEPVELRYRCADGSYRWLQWLAPPFTPGASLIHASARDIQEERRIQRELKMLARIAERTSNAVVLTDAKGCVEWVNEGFEKMSGYSLADMIGRTPGSVLRVAADPDNAHRRMSEAQRRGESFREEVLNRSKSGHLYWVQIEGQPIFDEHGRVEGFMALELDITERKESQLRIAQSERLLQDAGRMAQLGGWEVDLQELRPIWSDEVCRIHEVPLGHRPSMEEAVGYYPEPYRGKISALVDHSIATGQGWDTEMEILTAKGNRKWVRAVGRPEMQDGVCVRLLGSFQDITQRRAQDEQLRREEARNRALLLALPDYLVQLSADGTVLDFHDSESGSPNFPLLGSVGLPLEDFLEAKDWQAFRAALDRLEGESSLEVVDFELWLDQKLHFFEARLTKTLLGDVLLLLRDLTDRREAERASSSYLEDLEQASQYLEINATQLRELLEQVAREKAKAEAANQAKSQFLAVMSHEIRTPLNAVLGMSRLLVDSGLNADQLEMATTVVRSGQGLLEIINDILDFSKIEAGMVEIEKIAFDLEQYMEDAIEIMSGKARERKLDLLFWFDPLVPARILGDPGRLRQITLNFLSNAIKFTREGYVLLVVRLTEEGMLRIEVEDTGPGIPSEKLPLLFERFTQEDSTTTRKFGGTGLGLAIVKELAELMGGRAEATSEVGKGSRFAIVIPFQPAEALGEHGEEDAGLPPYGNAVCVDGSPQFQRSISRLLFEIERHTILLPGSGSKQKVRVQDGEFHGPIKGSDLVRRIWARHNVPAPAPIPIAPLREFNGLRILLVEDNIVNQKVGVRLLEKMGCRVDLAGNGLEAVEMVRQFPYQLILMDCQMPEMDGFEAARAIRQLEGEMKQVPIVALTAAATNEDRDRCLASGMNAYLTKPITMDDLAQAIEDWTKASRERRELLAAS
jgi:PAS domain S-box-containing protein